MTASFFGGIIGKLMTFNAEGLDFVLTALFVVLFPEGKKRPQVIDYLSLKLPAAMMGLLVIYCLKGMDFSSAPFGAAEIIGVGVTAGLHVWKRNVLLSIAVGTAVYMLLIRFVF